MVALTDIPNSASTGEIELDMIETPFGDGYTAVAEMINPTREKWALSFGPLSIADGKTLIDYFKTNRGVTQIDWTPPGESVALKYRLVGPLRRTYNGATMEVGFGLKQIYDNV